MNMSQKQSDAPEANQSDSSKLAQTGSDAQTGAQTGPHFELKTLYIKDASFEAPRSPHAFNEEWKPKVTFDMNIGTEKLSDALYEVVLHITLTVTTQDDKSIYLLELQQAGVFNLVGFTEEVIKRLVSTTCPEILFPYVREAVSSLVMRGGFPQMVLPPMNFEAMYAQYLANPQATPPAKNDEEAEMVRH
jgi:preprotein translocase subunit SecB